MTIESSPGGEEMITRSLELQKGRIAPGSIKIGII